MSLRRSVWEEQRSQRGRRRWRKKSISKKRRWKRLVLGSGLEDSFISQATGYKMGPSRGPWTQEIHESRLPEGNNLLWLQRWHVTPFATPIHTKVQSQNYHMADFHTVVQVLKLTLCHHPIQRRSPPRSVRSHSSSIILGRTWAKLKLNSFVPKDDSVITCGPYHAGVFARFYFFSLFIWHENRDW